MAYREMVHNMFSHAGAVRIDHVISAYSGFVVDSRRRRARGGAYVTYATMRR